jgi:hypothetical protein
MSLRNVPKYIPAAVAFAAWILVAPGVGAVAANANEAATNVVSSSDVCHPFRGPCQKAAHRINEAAAANSASAPGQEVARLNRYAVSESCHPAYNPSWIACAKRTGNKSMQVANAK